MLNHLTRHARPLMRPTFTLLALLGGGLGGACATPTLAEAPQTVPPRIDSVVPLAEQPYADDPAVIWHDDFSSDKPYAEKAGPIDEQVGFGGVAGSLRAHYVEGQAPGGTGTGSRRLFFGDSEDRRNIVREGEHFRDIYWRIYVKHQHGWTGGSPAKMSRATSIVGPGWRQGMIAHIWDGGQSLATNPATGIRDSQIVTTKYNDFDNLRWWRSTPGDFPVHSTEEAGYWVPVEARAKLNTPGQADGEMRLWINGRLEVEQTGLDWHGNYTDHGINAVFLEAYWNRGSPVTQSRWYDNFVVSTEPIGPVYADRNPELIKRVAPDAEPGIWQVEVATDDEGRQTVWQSQPIRDTDRVRVDADAGRFHNQATRLAPAGLYHVRVRERRGDDWSNWSHWHQPFQTRDEE